VTRDTISGWGGMDPRNGTIIERRHELAGQSFAGKVLMFPGAVVLRVPAMTELDKDPLSVIETGDHVTVDADARIVEVRKRGA